MGEFTVSWKVADSSDRVCVRTSGAGAVVVVGWVAVVVVVVGIDVVLVVVAGVVVDVVVGAEFGRVVEEGLTVQPVATTTAMRMRRRIPPLYRHV
jgi:predicted metalloprotease